MIFGLQQVDKINERKNLKNCEAKKNILFKKIIKNLILQY